MADLRTELELRRAELFAKTEDAALRPDYYFDPARSPYPPGTRAWCAATLASRDRLENTILEFTEDQQPDELLRFPSTIEPVERAYGGFYGVTSLIAEPGLGKTMLAWSVALQAAATQKWNVVFFAGELDEGEMIERRAREMTVHESAIDGVDYLKMVNVGIGQTTVDFCCELAGLDPELPILVVMDSINTIATLSRRDYLRTLEDFAIWAMMSRRISRGACSFLLVSETNKKGNSKGEKLEYWSDLAIGMTGKKGEIAVDFTVKKVRRGKWVHLGMLTRNWDTNRFYTKLEMDEINQLRLVAVGGIDF